MVSISRLLAALRSSTMKLKCGSVNHFGIHRPSLLVYDIGLILEELNQLLYLCSSPTSGAAEAGPSYSILETSVSSDIECITARIWWSKRNGTDEWCMGWTTFAQLFQADYGEQAPRAMQKLHDVLSEYPPPLVPSLHTGRLMHEVSSQENNELIGRVNGWTSSSAPQSFSRAKRPYLSNGKEGSVWLLDEFQGEAMQVEDVEEEGEKAGGGDGSLQACSNQTRPSLLPRPVVTVSRFNDFTKNQDCLYDAFQAVSDPDCIVYAMGVVDDDSHSRVLHPIVIEPLLGVAIIQVCCGGQHAACLSDEGEIYTWGRGGFGRLGHGTTAHATTPRLVERLRGIRCRQVACGFAYTAAVSEDGGLYMWGAGENGRLGLGDTQDRHVPTKVRALAGRVKQVFAGSVHTCALLEDEHVYSFGKYEYTGHGSDADILFPRVIPEFEDVRIAQISVGPGGYHTIALTCSGIVYTWGHNRVGQLGYMNTEGIPRNMHGAFFVPKPQPVPLLSDKGIIQVVAGWGHSAALSKTGQVFICGRNVQGQLGLGNPEKFLQNERGHHYQAGFRLVSALLSSHVTHISCGGEHSVAITADSEVYTFGAGHRGQLGHGTDANEHLPKLVEAMKDTRRHMLQVSCGNNCTLILAGGPRVPSLYKICLDTLRKNKIFQDDCNNMLTNEPQINKLKRK